MFEEIFGVKKIWFNIEFKEKKINLAFKYIAFIIYLSSVSYELSLSSFSISLIE